MVICRARGMIVYQKRILLMRHTNRDFYCLPWGKIEEDELVQEGIVRELYEELWVYPQQTQLVAMQNFCKLKWDYENATKQSNIDFIYRIHNAQDYFDWQDVHKSSHAFERQELKRVDINAKNADIDIQPNFICEIAKKIVDEGLDNHTISMYT